jgi:DNA-binding NarL/FixJ family response regulator
MFSQIVSLIENVCEASRGAKIITLIPDCDFPCLSEIGHCSSAILFKKSSGLADLIKKINCLQVGTHETTSSSSVNANPAIQNASTSLLASLTVLEFKIIQFVMSGYTSREIGSQLQLPPRTIDNHRHRILEKLKLPNTTSLINAFQLAAAYMDLKEPITPD